MGRPKRSRKKDNPYILEYIEETKCHKVIFKDGNGITNTVMVTEEVFDIMNRFELDDVSEINEYKRHIEYNEIYENNLNKRAFNKQVSLEDEIINKSIFEDLIKAVNMLPEIQKRRIKKYYFENKTQKQIAEEENVDIRAIQYTLHIALKKLKEILK